MDELKEIAKKDKPKRGTHRARFGKVRPWVPNPRQVLMYSAVISGRTCSDVGSEYGCTGANVHKIVKQMRTYLTEQYLHSVNEQRTEQSERLMHIYREAMDAWRRSVGETTVTTTKETQDEVEVTRRVETLAGNPAFLMVARSVLADIRTIWGVDAKTNPVDGVDEGDRVAGVPRQDSIKLAIKRLSDTAKAMQNPSNN